MSRSCFTHKGLARTIGNAIGKPRLNIKNGTTVVSSEFGYTDSAPISPNKEVGGVSIRRGTVVALKVVDYRNGFYKVETMGAEKIRGWVPMDIDTELEPQLSVSPCVRRYLESDRINAPALSGRVKVEEINQGYLGDCYLVGAMAALAHANSGDIVNAICKGDKERSYVTTVLAGLTGNDPDEYDVGRLGSEDNKTSIDELKRAIRKGLPVAVSSKGRKVLPNYISR